MCLRPSIITGRGAAPPSHALPRLSFHVSFHVSVRVSQLDPQEADYFWVPYVGGSTVRERTDEEKPTYHCI